MSKRTPWFPASIKPVRDGWYEWQCASVLGSATARAQWAVDDWIHATGPTLFTPRFECLSCRWRGLTRPAEEA